MSLANPTKTELVINDNILIKTDKIGYEYAQQDSEASGNSEDGTMYRDVIGLKNKVYCKFEDPELRTGENLDNVLYLARKKTHMMVNYYDRAEKARVTKKMYFVIDKIELNPCEIDEDNIAEPFEARFIQMTIDSVE
jgi:hypothetical protein